MPQMDDHMDIGPTNVPLFKKKCSKQLKTQIKHNFFFYFLDTQVSLAPTHVSKLVSW